MVVISFLRSGALVSGEDKGFDWAERPTFVFTGMYMLWFNFVLCLIFIFLYFKLIIIHFHTQKQRKIKIKLRKKVNHNIYTLPQVQISIFNTNTILIFYDMKNNKIGENQCLRRSMLPLFKTALTQQRKDRV